MATYKRPLSHAAHERTPIAGGDTAPAATHEEPAFDAVAFVRSSFPGAGEIEIVHVTPSFVAAFVDDKRFKLYRGQSA